MKMWKLLWLLILLANISPNIEMQDTLHNKHLEVKYDKRFQLTLQNHLDLEDNTILCE